MPNIRKLKGEAEAPNYRKQPKQEPRQSREQKQNEQDTNRPGQTKPEPSETHKSQPKATHVDDVTARKTTPDRAKPVTTRNESVMQTSHVAKTIPNVPL